MKHQKKLVFSEKEQEIVQLLVSTGTKRIVAVVLVYIAHVPEATSRDIERGTDLRQPEVSNAVQFLTEKGWINCREIHTAGKGRPVRSLSLAVPFEEILELIAAEKKNEVKKQLTRIQKIKKNLAGISG